MSEEEIAPGVIFTTSKDGFKLALKDGDEEIIAWDYDEIASDPAAWFSSLQAVATAIRFGPTAAKNTAKTLKYGVQSPGGALCCNICSSKFIVQELHPFVFSATLNGHRYLEFQCSLPCNEQRKKEVYEAELGEAFMDMWKNKVCKNNS